MQLLCNRPALVLNYTIKTSSDHAVFSRITVSNDGNHYDIIREIIPVDMLLGERQRLPEGDDNNQFKMVSGGCAAQPGF